MARSKGGRSRGSGFRPPELRGTLGTLWRTTLQQAGVVRDVIERGAREGRSRLDEARTSRKRTDALADLGEIVLELIRNGEIDVGELPEAEDLVRFLDELDGADDNAPADDSPRSRDVAQAPTRRRFDDRSSSDDTGDGTVSSSRWTPPRSGSPARVWRPTAAADDTPDPRDTTPTEPPPNRRKPAGAVAAPPVAVAAPRKGGIRFDSDDDSDLGEYMHPDDVPPKPPKDGAE